MDIMIETALPDADGFADLSDGSSGIPLLIEKGGRNTVNLSFFFPVDGLNN